LNSFIKHNLNVYGTHIFKINLLIIFFNFVRSMLIKRLCNNSSLHNGKSGVFDGEDKVDNEDDPGYDGHHSHRNAGVVLRAVGGVRLHGDRADGDEQHAADKVDEQLEHRQVRPHQVRQQDRGNNDCIPDNGSSSKEVCIDAAKVF